MANELTIKITREKNGELATLSDMSVDAAESVKIFIESFAEFAKLNGSSSVARISLKEGSIESTLAFPETADNATEEILEIINNESDKPMSVKIFNSLHKRITENGLTYEVSLKADNNIFDITEKFKAKRFTAKKSAPLKWQEEVRFIQGELFETGGKKITNVHIKLFSGEDIRVNCSKEQARGLNKYLYTEVFVSVVRKWRGDEEVFDFIDSYLFKKQFDHFKALYDEVTYGESLSRFDKIRETIIKSLVKYGSESPRIPKIMKLYCHPLSDRGVVRTILMVLKPVRHEEAFHELYHKLATVLKDGNTNNL